MTTPSAGGRPRKVGGAVRALISERRPGMPLGEVGRLVGPRANEIRAFDEAAKQAKLPDARSIAGLAKALDVQPIEVLIACAHDAGLDVVDRFEPDQRRLLQLAARVPREERPAMVELLANVLRFAESVDWAKEG